MVRLVRFALRQRLTIVGFFVAMLVAGGIAFYNLNIEAYPDPVPPMVELVTQSSGLSAEEMERNVTIPIEVQMSGLPHMNAIRAISLFGKLRVWDTEHNNGALIYLLLADHAIEIVADRALDRTMSTEQWQTLISDMQSAFQSGHFSVGQIGRAHV